MSTKGDRPARTVRVLVSGHLPPPMGGMATFYESLLASSLPTLVDFAFVQTSSQKRSFERSGRVSFSNIFSSFADCWRFVRAVRTFRPEIAHIGTAFGVSFVKHSICVVIARLYGIKVLLHPHCSLAVLYIERPGWWKWYFRRIMALTKGVVALSQEWLGLSTVMPGCKIYALPNAIGLRDYREIARERAISRDSLSPLHVLYLGYIGKAKGSFDLVDAAQSAIKKGYCCEFRLIGGELSPGERAALCEKIKLVGLEDHVSLHKPVAGPEKLAAFRWADVFIYPSYAEGMPMAVIEAMACGLPVVASKVGGLPDLITEEVNGLLVDPGEPDQIVESIGRLMDQPTLVRSMGRQGNERVMREYDIENRVTELVEIYYSVLAQG